MALRGGSRRDHLERAVMQVLWRAPEPLAATDVVAALPDRHLAVTTVLTVLERLRGKGLVERERVGRGYVHRAARSREDLAAEAMLDVLADGTDGAHRSLALARFATAMSPEDAAALRAALSPAPRWDAPAPSSGAAGGSGAPAPGSCCACNTGCGCCAAGRATGSGERDERREVADAFPDGLR